MRFASVAGEKVQRESGGVATLRAGQVVGGDTWAYYSGAYQLNDSDEARVILIFDIWSPNLTEAERDLVRAATEGVAAYYAGEFPFATGL